MGDPDADLARYGAELADAVEAVLAHWVAGSVRAGGGSAAEASAAGAAAVADVVPELRRLLALDVDAQRTTPMALLRQAAERVTDQVPATFADIDESLREPGLIWGAAKARAHLARHRPPAS